MNKEYIKLSFSVIYSTQSAAPVQQLTKQKSILRLCSALYVKDYTNMIFYVPAFLLVFIGFAHSYLGERFILIRLFRREDIPKILGSSEFTKKTLRFAWHLTTIAWFGFAAILVGLAHGKADITFLVYVICVTFFMHFIISLVASGGKHFSWLFFLIISVSCFFGKYV
ncbi:hypothetical protein [Aliikangiella sp. G2MR2-5]|uniref:hypothetical protein n=1 Tax=Aliikangiella sp. G2MR2-5 TaxID=2788943 RepID=UPI001AEDC5A2|nr:hypothetical protein [Aliikangiella sp. G2MR2-5]